MTMWMVRAGPGNTLFDRFVDENVVAIGWDALGDLSQYPSRAALAAELRQRLPDGRAPQTSAGMTYRFAHEMQPGDWVITYDQQRRIYAVGAIDGDYAYSPDFDSTMPNIRPVRWEATEVSRDQFSASTKNTLGSVLAVFRLPDYAEQEVLAVLGKGEAPPAEAQAEAGETGAGADESTVLDDLENKSLEAIKDRLVRLDSSQMEGLVAGLLRAMGYKTRVSRPGPDRGKDIMASPDGFGFEAPRIVVQVKHRPQTVITAPDVREFLGGRHPDDKGLYVSTGGFSKDALYEAERANIPVTLMNLDNLVGALLDNYAAIDSETQRLLPLKRIFWPLG